MQDKTNIDQYCAEHSLPESELAQQLTLDTKQTMIGAEMLSGSSVSGLLKFLIGLIGAGKVLEIGTYTGHGALSMAEALPNDGQLITLEKSAPAVAFAKKYFDKSPHGHKITQHKGTALDILPEIIKTDAGSFDLIFIDADKQPYPDYVNYAIELCRPNGLVIVDNALWNGTVLEPDTLQAKAIAKMNQQVLQDPRVENILLPISDGLHIMRKL